MKHEINVWLEDIRKSMEEIHQFLPEPISCQEFEKDLKTRKAVERNIEIGLYLFGLKIQRYLFCKTHRIFKTSKLDCIINYVKV